MLVAGFHRASPSTTPDKSLYSFISHYNGVKVIPMIPSSEDTVNCTISTGTLLNYAPNCPIQSLIFSNLNGFLKSNLEPQDLTIKQNND